MIELIPNMDPLVQVRELSKVYPQGGRNVIALSRVSLGIKAAEFVALRGPSGSGKSTLLHIIAGIDRPSSGHCAVDGVELGSLGNTELTRWRRAHVGFVFQTFNLIPVLTAFENVEMPLLLSRLTANERRSHVEAALELVGLADRIDHLPKELSGGQEQRVAIARALVNNPSILLADEPTGNLDSATGNEIMALFERLYTQGNTIVLVTHEHDIALHAHRIIHVRDGKIEKDEKVR